MTPENSPQKSKITKLRCFTVIVLCFVNLINYMDRFTIAGVLADIQKEFEISDGEGGLLQTVFIFSYMVFALLFGYLGDRWIRKYIMLIGIFIWSGTTLAGSFSPSFGWFAASRAFVGIGEASYSVLAPTIISDLFVRRLRSKMLAIFFFTIPVGAGLGYIVGSATAKRLDDWRWALRVTPGLGLLALILIIFIEEPTRGQSEGSRAVAVSYAKDVKELLKSPSFILSTLGFTCVSFVLGALSWWAPTFLHDGMSLLRGSELSSLDDVCFKFGAISMASGLIGVLLGSLLSQVFIKKFPKVDPMICGIGLLLSIPLLIGAMVVVQYNEAAAYVLIFFGEVAINLNWSIVTDILLYVVPPARRSTASSFQILIAHAFGDAGSPYLVGVISDALKKYVLSKENSPSPKTEINIKFKSLQNALFITGFAELLGAVMFFVNMKYLVRDREKAAVVADDVDDK